MRGSGRWKDLAVILNYIKILDKRQYEELKRGLEELSSTGHKNFRVTDSGFKPKKELVLKTLREINPLSLPPNDRDFLSDLINRFSRDLNTREDLENKVSSLAEVHQVPKSLVKYTPLSSAIATNANANANHALFAGIDSYLPGAILSGVGRVKKVKPVKKCSKCGLEKL
jgi:hypothetical protein